MNNFADVTATDTEGGVGHLQVIIQILDVNEFAPEFNTSGIEKTIEENLPVGTTLFVFTASDADGSEDDREVGSFCILGLFSGSNLTSLLNFNIEMLIPRKSQFHVSQFNNFRKNRTKSYFKIQICNWYFCRFLTLLRHRGTIGCGLV